MLVIVNDTDINEFGQYMTKLESAGWTQYTTNTFGENKFVTYTTDKYTVNAGYYDYENAARIIIEPLAKPVGLEADNKYEKVTTSQITMLGVEYISSSTKEPVSNGLSMLIRLEDGRFVVVDGAFSSNAGSKSADLLINELKEQSKDYLKSGEKITIAAWIITHAHGDHYGMINKHYSKFATMKVEKFFVNFLSETERMRAINSATYGKNWSATEGNTWSQLITAAKALKADVQYVHVGQVFYVADLRMDILYTIESYAPKVCNALNTSSLTIKMTLDSGDTFLMTGDTTGNGMEIAAKMFGDYMQCDILQVAHHGGTTWGNDSGMIYAYGVVAPEVLLWPRGMNNFDSAKNKNYNKWIGECGVVF
jgi:beta-lactamase superfamily II metal-dependent hydrolase